MNFKIVKIGATDKRLTGMHMRVFMLLSASKLLMQSKLAELLSAKNKTSIDCKRIGNVGLY